MLPNYLQKLLLEPVIQGLKLLNLLPVLLVP